MFEITPSKKIIYLYTQNKPRREPKIIYKNLNESTCERVLKIKNKNMMIHFYQFKLLKSIVIQHMRERSLETKTKHNSNHNTSNEFAVGIEAVLCGLKTCMQLKLGIESESSVKDDNLFHYFLLIKISPNRCFKLMR